MDLNRRPNETPLEHHRRLVYGKLEDRTLSDYDYAELSDYMFGAHYAPDETRKRAYGSLYTLKLLDSERRNSRTDAKMIAELNEKIDEFKREKQKFFDQRREYNKLQAEAGRREHLYDRLADAANNLSETVGDVIHKLVELDTSENEAVIMFSDWHYGMTAHNAFNTYDTKICKERVETIVTRAASRIAQNGCSKLHVVVLGDLLNGAIHSSSRVASEELTADQLMQVSEILAQAIIFLSQYVEETDVHITYGNHARTVQNKHDSIHRDNMERLIPWWLKTRILAEGRVSGESLNINVVPESDTEFLLLNVCGHDICAAHGDLDCVKTSPRMLSTLFHKKYGKDIEYILLGDKHHREDFEELGVTAMLCGSLCGSDDYANDRRLFSTPSQMLLIFNPDDGLDAEYRIKCN